ncbi:MAG: sacsin N-terminal ATP-binding-like domain-containing protein [Planctomycetaceae bacterium]
MQPPPYFEEICRRAQNRWDQLEADPDLAAPWHQLFKQVQSPRHVISELLQNADDADATKAHVNIDNGEFVFSHNGDDFEAQHFESLCRFGYSNKRALHTIGFRGIGFKSTFSLGNEVQLATPTLSVAFRRSRFTQPHWIGSNWDAPHETTVRVAFEDDHRKVEIAKNLTTWLDSPASLLFFRSLRHITLGTEEVVWKSVGSGPVPDSEWVTLANCDEQPVLLVRSTLEEFPAECVAEIRQERMLSDAEDGALPPCKVEIVIGLEGRLFVVLPTGVKTALPFACNAPFIQDPARVKIKDPETSPTNRWLLERAGMLAGQTMLRWLARRDLQITERADAYRLLPPASPPDDSIEGACLEIVSDAFSQAIESQPILLTNSGDLATKDSCIAIPGWIVDVWDDEQVSALFDSEHRPLFCSEVTTAVCSRLVQQGYLTAFGDDEVLAVLRDNHLPRPKTWRKLLRLWAAVMPHVTKYASSWSPSWKDIRIVPVQAQDTLYSAQEVVRLGEKKLLHSESDWDFLSKYLLVMNPNWPRFLAEQRRAADASDDEELAEQVQAAERTLQAIGLGDSSDATKVIEQVASSFFDQEEVEIEDCVRLAQISAALSVQASVNFEFVTLAGTRSSRAQVSPLIADSRLDFDTFASENWCIQHVLHEDYWASFRSCTAEEWQQWLTSGRSGLLGFIPLVQYSKEFYGKPELTKLLKQRGHNGNVGFPYVTSHFVIEDWDFSEEHWRYWETLARSDEQIWSKLVQRIVEQPPTFWSNALTARMLQVATSRSRRVLDAQGLLPAWIVKLRQRECLPDTWGKTRQPVDLLRRTPETESLLDIEPFVKADLDTEAARPLLSRLGVRGTPTGPDRLIDRLMALATIVNPPVFEVQKWCHRLDAMLPKCSTDEFQKIKSAFHTQSLILTTDGTWAKADEVFLSPDDHDVPGAAIVHEALRPLTIWQKIDVKDRPTLELVVAWLQKLPQDQKLAPEVIRRVKELLPRHAHRIWFDCGCWLNLEGEWTNIENLRYSISMHSLSAWGHLFPAIKKQVADFQRLTADAVHDEPFSDLPSLASCLQERVQTNLFSADEPVVKPWLRAFGAGLYRIVTESKEETARIRDCASRLARTAWQNTTALETVPYLDGTPAGTARPNDVLWDGLTLFVVDRPITRLLRQIARELSRPFDDPEIEDAIKFCIDRSPEHVAEYLEQNFTLAELEESTPGEIGSPVPTEAVESPDNDDPEHANDNFPEEAEVQSSDAEADSEESAMPQDGFDDSDEPEPDARPAPTRNPAPRPKSKTLVDRYAEVEGFKREANVERYFHPDGRWLQRGQGMTFPWEMYSPAGELLKCFFVKEHCITQEPLQIGADVWEAFRRSPDTHTLLMTNADGSPLELPGQKLLDMKNDGLIILHPATYRLVYHPIEVREEVLG